jgi:hypothetical protein
MDRGRLHGKRLFVRGDATMKKLAARPPRVMLRSRGAFPLSCGSISCLRSDLNLSARRAKAASDRSQPRRSDAAVTASASTTAITALTCAASNENVSSRSICPSVSSDRCLERHCWNGSHSASGTGRLSKCVRGHHAVVLAVERNKHVTDGRHGWLCLCISFCRVPTMSTRRRHTLSRKAIIWLSSASVGNCRRDGSSGLTVPGSARL